MREHSLRSNDIKLGYEQRVIINQMNLQIPNGKISVIIGANGSGKSTLLKAFSGLIKPMQGNITLDDVELADYKSKELAKILGLLPQSPLVPEGIKVLDLVARGRYPHRGFMQPLRKTDFDFVYDALKRMGVEDLANRNVDELSGGQRQRVWIALVLAQNTDILLLDEPTTYLDIAYQVDILDTLAQLNKSKETTVIMVLHDINLSARYADYIFAMKDGNLVAQGKPDEIITPELMEEVYGLKCMVIEDPISFTPLIIPIGKFKNIKKE